MAFIRSGTTILSFAEYQDVVLMDQRIFDENEGLTDEVVEDILIRSTERILTQLRQTKWYRELAFSLGASALTLPAVTANNIISRYNDFTDLAVYYGMYEYILPKVADFGSEDNAERVKIEVYRNKYATLFDELLADGSWYDYDLDGTLELAEYRPYPTNYQRVR